MKKFLSLIALLLCMTAFCYAQNGRIVLTPSSLQKSGFAESESINGFTTTFSFNSIESQLISNEKGTFSEISIDGSFPYGGLGEPTLPKITKMIAIPEGATPTISLNNYSISEYQLADYGIETLTAMQAPVAKNIDPTTVEYVVNEAAYARDEYTTNEIASVEYLGTLFGMRLGKVTVRPVQYNAAQGKIRVYNDVEVSVDFHNVDSERSMEMMSNTYSPAFNSIYDQMMNKNVLFQAQMSKSVYDDHPDMYHTPVRMLVICYSGFKNNAKLNQWLTWKLQKGYYVDIFYTDETGTTSSNIANFIKTKYNASVSAGNAYSYLIVIGDTGQVAQYKTVNVDSQSGNCATDIGYASIDYSTSNDYYPEMLYSRISVENATHLENYIDKVLMYEKYEFPDGGNYLNNVKIIGGWDSSWTSRVAAPTVTYASTYYFNSSNTTYGGFEGGNISMVTSTSSTGGYSSSNNGAYSGINNGFCFLNYTAHGDKQEWYQPKLSATQVASLTNTNKYFFAVGNCCLTGNFNNTSTSYSPGSAIGTNACFAETMIRVPSAGAIAYIGNSPVSYWFEDFYWGVGSGVNFNSNYNLVSTPTTANTTKGVYDAMFEDAYWNSASSLLNIGDLAVASAFESSLRTSASQDYYWLYYHVFGDGSVMPYITKPETNTVSHAASIMSGATSFTVNALAGSYVAITDNSSTIYGVAVANESGVANVTFTEAIPTTGTLYVVVTRQQRQPYFGTVDIAIANEPFVSIQNYTPTATSFGTTNTLAITLVNQGGVATVGNTNVTLSTTDEYLTLTNATASFGVMSANGGTANNNTFGFTVAENVPDGHVATINAVITNGTYTWNGTMTITISGAQCDAPTGFTAVANGTSATLTWDAQTSVPFTIEDDFEDHTAFTINSQGTVGWTYIDGDGQRTYSFQNYNAWTNANEPMAFIVFDPTQITYSGNGGGTLASKARVTAYSGSQFIASVCAQNAANDDYIVSPELNFGEDFTFSFYYRGGHSYTETFEAVYSTTTNEKSAFTNVLGTGTAAGGTNNVTWQQKSYTVPANAKYVAIHCTSNDQYYFCVDDITISGNVVSGIAAVNIYDNGVLIASNVTAGTYTATDLSVGEHCFSVRGICDDNSESMSATSCVTIEGGVTPTYTVTTTAGQGGSVTPAGSTTVNQGDSFTFTATPNSCYEIASATVNGAPVILNNGSYTITNVSANTTVDVTFNPITYTVTTNAGVGGTINAASTVACGQDLTFTVTADACYEIEDVQVNGVSLNLTAGSYTVVNVSANQTITATFSQIQYAITATAGANGTITPAGVTNVNCGGTQTYTIAPNTGYQIVDVTVDGASQGAIAAYTFTDVRADATITATFELIPATEYEITVESENEGGEVTPTGTTTVEEGDSFTFTVTPYDCYEIGTVTVNGTEVPLTDGSYTITNVSANTTVDVTFNPITYTVTTNAGIGGSINAASTIGCGQDLTFTVNADACYEIEDVQVNGVSLNLVAGSYTVVNVSADQTITATFSQLNYAITATAGANGTITPAGVTNVTCGESQTYTITPNEGYMIQDVTVDGASQGAISTYTFNNVTAVHTINATFELIPAGEVVITINSDSEGGEVSPTGSQSVTEGEDFTFTVTAYDCYEIGTVTVDGTEVILNNGSYTITNVTENTTVNVTFNQLSYTITATAGEGGVVSPAGETTVYCGEGQVYTITANAGYSIVDVTVDGVSQGAITTYEFVNVTENHTINAVFNAEACESVEGLTVSIEAYGNVIAWTANENATSYKLYKNDELLSTVTTSSYVDMAGVEGDTYYVITVCEYGESDPSEPVVAENEVSIEDAEIVISIYPNPTAGMFTVECENATTIEIFNTIGQIVDEINVNANQVNVDASRWANGVYNVRITTDDSNVIVKQIVKR